MSSSDMSKPPRRWLQMRLRTLFLLVTAFGVWWGFHLQAARRQAASIRAIHNIGGWCYYDYQAGGGKRPNHAAVSSVPKWLRDGLGHDVFHNVVEVNLVYRDDGRRRLDNIAGRPDDLRCLAGFPKLKRLLLHETQASDVALEHIAQLKNLEELWIWDGHDVSDAGVAYLKHLRKLKHVHLSNSQITDDSLNVFSNMPRIEYLSLQGNRFTDRGLAHLENKVQLTSLWIGLKADAITDQGLVHLKGLNNLQELDLQGASITAAGLEHLTGLKNLKSLYITGTKSRLDAARFQEAMPGCKVW